MKALAALEEVIVDAATKEMTPEMAKGWERYQKVKAHFLAPGTPAEGRLAMKQALIDAVKLAL
jgi:hypothetical protein